MAAVQRLRVATLNVGVKTGGSFSGGRESEKRDDFQDKLVEDLQYLMNNVQVLLLQEVSQAWGEVIDGAATMRGWTTFWAGDLMVALRPDHWRQHLFRDAPCFPIAEDRANPYRQWRRFLWVPSSAEVSSRMKSMMIQPLLFSSLAANLLDSFSEPGSERVVVRCSWSPRRAPSTWLATFTSPPAL